MHWNKRASKKCTVVNPKDEDLTFSYVHACNLPDLFGLVSTRSQRSHNQRQERAAHRLIRGRVIHHVHQAGEGV